MRKYSKRFNFYYKTKIPPKNQQLILFNPFSAKFYKI